LFWGSRYIDDIVMRRVDIVTGEDLPKRIRKGSRDKKRFQECPVEKLGFEPI